MDQSDTAVVGFRNETANAAMVNIRHIAAGQSPRRRYALMLVFEPETDA